ncbi:nitronate monooxygenase [uncultured Ruegeria sp.]|uniref:nitronate monooxygenase n=1 Tax=uncultured Ruegeria sp. TaxID=259304 RepID=UPI002637BA8B|nr:nitronate monooxygenase [uncultured Ruegeria sp.]
MALVIQTASSAIGGKRSVDAGADILVAQGRETGGHVRGMVANLPPIPGVLNVAGSVQVLAAGGISDGRWLAAALCLGASGVVIGTRFLATPESTAHSEYIVLRNAEADRWPAEGYPGNRTRHRSGEMVAMRGSAPFVTVP